MDFLQDFGRIRTNEMDLPIMTKTFALLCLVSEKVQLPLYVTVLHKLAFLRRILPLGNGVSYAGSREDERRIYSEFDISSSHSWTLEESCSSNPHKDYRIVHIQAGETMARPLALVLCGADEARRDDVPASV